jgi:hypothetical protein
LPVGFFQIGTNGTLRGINNFLNDTSDPFYSILVQKYSALTPNGPGKYMAAGSVKAVY